MPVCIERVRNERRHGFLRRNLPTFDIQTGDLIFTCFILPEEDTTELPHAVLAYMPPFQEFWTNGGCKQVVLAIDGRVPKNVRTYAVMHEIWRDLFMNHPNRYVDAALREIKEVRANPAVSPAQATKYLKMRRTYWQNLIAFAAKHAETYSPCDRQGYQATLMVFEREVNPSDEG